MKIFDFNIHLPYLKSDDVNLVVEQDMKLEIKDISNGLLFHVEHFKKINAANVLLFNPYLFDNNTTELYPTLSNYFNIIFTTNLVDFRRKDIEEYLNKAKMAGLKAIMFNSYLQKIADHDFYTVLETCKIAERLKLIICIDGSFGTSKMYTFNNMKLACYIANAINKTQIVIVHSGGCNIINAMLLALDKKNVWLDTSFSLTYYLGSSIEIDFAFAYRKMDFKRVIFGSDHPYIQAEKAITDHLLLFEKYKFSQTAIEDIMFNNAMLLFNSI